MASPNSGCGAFSFHPPGARTTNDFLGPAVVALTKASGTGNPTGSSARAAAGFAHLVISFPEDRPAANGRGAPQALTA